MIDQSRYLCFSLGNEEFAIPLLSIKEVIGLPEITPVPQTPSHFLGIINLRGQVIPIMDLRLKFGIKISKNEETSVMILDLGQSQLGVVVDQVNSVQNLTQEDISEKPVLDKSKMHDYITGVFRNQSKLILMIDIARALSLDDKTVLTKQTSKVA